MSSVSLLFICSLVKQSLAHCLQIMGTYMWKIIRHYLPRVGFELTTSQSKVTSSSEYANIFCVQSYFISRRFPPQKLSKFYFALIATKNILSSSCFILTTWTAVWWEVGMKSTPIVPKFVNFVRIVVTKTFQK